MSDNNDNPLKFINEDDRPRQKSYLDSLWEDSSVPSGRFKNANEYMALHPPPCPECGNPRDGHTHINVLTTIPAPQPLDRARPKPKRTPNDLLRVFAKPQSGPRIENIWQEIREQIASCDDPFIADLIKIAWKSAGQTTFKGDKESPYDYEQRKKETYGFIMLLFQLSMDKIRALPSPQCYGLAKTIALRRGRDFNQLYSRTHEVPISQCRRRKNRWKGDPQFDYDPSQEDMDDFSASNDSLESRLPDSDVNPDWTVPYWKEYQERVLEDAISALPRKERVAIDMMFNSDWNEDAKPRTLEECAEAMTSYLGERVTIHQARYCLSKAIDNILAFVAKDPKLAPIVTDLEIDKKTLFEKPFEN